MSLKCPVMKTVAIAKPAKNLRMAVNNGYVYTCCAGCPAAFTKNPEKYITELRDPVSEAPRTRPGTWSPPADPGADVRTLGRLLAWLISGQAGRDLPPVGGADGPPPRPVDGPNKARVRIHPRGLQTLLPDLRIPSAEEEMRDPSAAREIYETYTRHLIARTRGDSTRPPRPRSPPRSGRSVTTTAEARPRSGDVLRGRGADQRGRVRSRRGGLAAVERIRRRRGRPLRRVCHLRSGRSRARPLRCERPGGVHDARLQRRLRLDDPRRGAAQIFRRGREGPHFEFRRFEE